MIRPEYREPLWPRWAVGPTGNRAMFYNVGDIPAGWELETPLPTEDNTVEKLAEELAKLREEYRVATGIEANQEWNAETIRYALSGGNTAPPDVDPEEADRLRSAIPASTDPERLQRHAARRAEKKARR
jgi:hypothetical protein